MSQQQYFYQFLQPISKELAFVACELENSIFTSPRTMLTHARIFIENILQHVMKIEKLTCDQWIGLKEQIDLLNDKGLLTPEIRDALHYIRKLGNQAAHDSRQFRYSEALLSWEETYKVVRWYIEVYGPIDFDVPEYSDPTPKVEQQYDSMELETRLARLELMLKQTLEDVVGQQELDEVAVTIENESLQQQPGFTTIRTISFQDETLEVPYFLRDAFLLPQRFDKSEMFLIRLGAEQQARIMSELPDKLEGLHKFVKRYNEMNDQNLFFELKTFIEEEKIRRQLQLKRPGELFFFYQSDYVVVTERLSKTPITNEQFTGFPSLIQQLNARGYHTIGQLPSELVTLAKYDNVGKKTLEKLFEQLKEK